MQRCQSKLLLLGMVMLSVMGRKTGAQNVLVAEGWNLFETETALFEMGEFGLHEFQSAPFGSLDFGEPIGIRNTGTADMIVQRVDDLNGPGLVDIDVQWSLTSVNPINLGSGPEDVTATVDSSDGSFFAIDKLKSGLFDSLLQLEIRFTGQISGTTFTLPYELGSLDVDWGRSPNEQNALKIVGVNYLLNGQDTTDDFWPAYFDHFGIGGNFVQMQMKGDAVPEPTSKADNFTILRGIYVSGELSDILESDDSYLKFNPGFTLNSSEPPVWIVFDGVLPSDGPSSLAFFLEAGANTPNLTQLIEAYNWNTDQYELVDSQSGSFNADQLFSIDLTNNVANFVENGTGRVRARIAWKPDGLVLLYPWTVCIDHVFWSATD